MIFFASDENESEIVEYVTISDLGRAEKFADRLLKGSAVEICGESFSVAKVEDETGGLDDWRVFMNLSDVQRILKSLRIPPQKDGCRRHP